MYTIRAVVHYVAVTATTSRSLKIIIENFDGHGFQKSGSCFEIKNFSVGAMRWWTSRSQTTYSTTPDAIYCMLHAWIGSGRDDAPHKFFVANVNVNSDGLNVNVNRFENDNVWNAENRNRMVVPKMKVSPLYYLRGVFVSRPFLHPPSILPISSNCSESMAYLSFGRHLFSHASCKKNFTPSSFDIEMVMRLIF